MQNQLHAVQFCVLSPNRKIIKDPNCGAQKGSEKFYQDSKVASHINQFSHNMNFANVKVVGVESNYHERLFFETCHSTLDPNAGNDHIVLPEAYKGITRA